VLALQGRGFRFLNFLNLFLTEFEVVLKLSVLGFQLAKEFEECRTFAVLLLIEKNGGLLLQVVEVNHQFFFKALVFKLPLRLFQT
jgi:hypothetical protein